MLKRKLLIIVFSLLLAVSLIGQISAGYSSLSTINEFENGIVDIEIKDDNVESLNKQAIMPHDIICEKPSIKNNGTDCYIRAKITVSDEEIENSIEVAGLNEKWIAKDDGYFYYTDVLKNKDVISIFESARLGDIDKKYQSSNFDFDIMVDAIQSKNFIINLDSQHPWGGVEVLKVNDTGGFTEYKVLPSTSFKVIYQDDVKGMIKNFDSFFNEIGKLMPEDSYEDVLEIQNNTNRHQTFYFTMSNSTNEEFLNNVVLKIIDEDNNIVYEGKMSDNKEIIIETLDANTNAKVKFRIEVPANIDNEFALDKSSVQWVFSVGHLEDVPQTGDNSHIEIYFLLMLVSIVGLIFSIWGMKKYEKNH